MPNDIHLFSAFITYRSSFSVVFFVTCWGFGLTAAGRRGSAVQCGASCFVANTRFIARAGRFTCFRAVAGRGFIFVACWRFYTDAGGIIRGGSVVKIGLSVAVALEL